MEGREWKKNRNHLADDNGCKTENCGTDNLISRNKTTNFYSLRFPLRFYCVLLPIDDDHNIFDLSITATEKLQCAGFYKDSHGTESVAIAAAQPCRKTCENP